MKQVTPVILFLFNWASCLSQISLTNVSSELLVVGIQHQWTIDNIEMKKILNIQVTNGKLEREANSLKVTPTKPGRLNLEIATITETNNIDTLTWRFTAVLPPPPTVYLAGTLLKSDTIRTSELLNSKGLVTRNNGWEFIGCIDFKVDDFKIELIRDSQILYEVFNQGNAFTSESFEVLRNCRDGDKLRFSNIHVNMFGDRIECLQLEIEVLN